MKRSVFVLCIIAACVCQSFGVSYEGGDGSEANPYQIATAEQFLQIEGSRDSFILLNDIDLSGQSFGSYVLDSSFDGILDGNGFAVTGLNISSGEQLSNVSLFYTLGNEAVVKNIGIKDFTIAAPLSTNVAALCVTNRGQIINCYAEGPINAKGQASGLCCFNWSLIRNSYFKGDITVADTGVSGLCLYNYPGSIILNSYSKTTIQAEGFVGGFCAGNAGTIINCYNVSTFNVSNDVYGFCANNLQGDIVSCFWDTEVGGSTTEGIGTSYNQDSFNGLTGLSTPEMAYRYTYIDTGWSVVDIENHSGTEDWYFIDGHTPVLAWQKEVPHYTVTFVTNISSSYVKRGKLVQQVPFGTSATAPVLDYYNHVGWDVDFSNVTSDLTVTAVHADDINKGDGTEGNPYKIYTIADLEAVNNDSYGYYELMNDLNISGLFYDKSIIDSFSGHFDGSFFSLIGLEIYNVKYDNIGLVGELTFSAVLRNIVLSNASVISCGSDDKIASLVGDSKGTIAKCCTENCFVLGDVDVGGLCGAVVSGEITQSYSTGKILGLSIRIGGLCGFSDESYIKDCYSECDVTAVNVPIGGFCGLISGGYLENCFSTGKVLKGYPFAHINDVDYLDSCFWLTDSNPDAEYGIPSDTMLYPGVVTGLNLYQMSRQLNFTSDNWDFVGESYNGNLGIWYMPADGHPLLSWQDEVPHHKVTFISGDYGKLTEDSGIGQLTEVVQFVAEGKSATSPIIESNYSNYSWIGWDKDFSNVTSDLTVNALYEDVEKGDGSESNPYKIYTVADFEEINSSPTACYLLMNDINLSGQEYPGCVINSFYGIFDGNGSELYGLTGNGFFSQLAQGAVVKNLGLTKVTINSVYDKLGAIAGVSDGVIQNCYVKDAFIKGGTDIGGLCGESRDIISSSYSLGRIIGSNRVGGLSGYVSDGEILDCYSGCDVEAGLSYRSGGLIGKLNSYAINCYSTGTIKKSIYDDLDNAFVGTPLGYVFDSFWLLDSNPDIEDNAISYLGLRGINGLEMSSLSNFIDAGWDFVGESNNGSLDKWYMPQDGFPILSWQDEVPHYRVSFLVGDNGNIISGEAVQEVIAGTSAVSPVVESYGAYKWVGWDVDFRCVMSDLIINAVYIDSEGTGDGSSENPIQIFTADDLDKINNAPDLCYILMDDINLAGRVYNRCVIEFFSGFFDGNGHSLYNMTIGDRLYEGGVPGAGLFCFIEPDGLVKDLKLIDFTITINENLVCGALASHNSGIVSGCSAEGFIESYYGLPVQSGGLCGINDGLVEKSYSKGSIFGGSAGGLCCINQGVIKNCFSECYISEVEQGGGLCYANSETMENCYSSGYGDKNEFGEMEIAAFCYDTLGIITNCFWNTQTYGVEDLPGVGVYNGDSSGVVGIGNAQMAYPNTFSNAGWDLAGRLGDGFEEIWVVSGGEFPQLSGLEPVSFDNQDVIGMISQWLGDGDYDIYPDGGDGVVDIRDWAWVAKGWANQDL